MKKNILKEKSFNFAVRIIKLHKHLCENKEFVLSKQILRSGTSIGANVREAEYAESKADFVHKMSISLKEINETVYWLELLQTTNYISKKQFDNINNDATEIIKLITTIVKTAKQQINE